MAEYLPPVTPAAGDDPQRTAGGVWALGHTGGARTTATPVVPAAPATATAISATSTPPAITAVALAEPIKTWTDQENRITVRYPMPWQAERHSDSNENGTLTQATSKNPLLRLTGPDKAMLDVVIYDATGTIDGDAPAIQALAVNNGNSTIFSPAQDATTNTPMSTRGPSPTASSALTVVAAVRPPTPTVVPPGSVIWQKHRDFSLRMESSMRLGKAIPTRASVASAIAHSVKFLT